MENIIEQEKFATFSIQNILILVMILFFGFTSLRFGMFGIGELILLCFCVLQVFGRNTILVSLNKHIFSTFWIFYIAIITFGYAVNTLLDIAPQSVKFDYRAYIVILFLCFSFELFFKRNSFTNLYSLLRFIYFGGLFVIGILYFLYLQGARSLFGFSLTYAGSSIFSPFANDYHQFAYFVTPLPFIGLYILSKEMKITNKILSVLGIVLCINIGLATTSSTLVSAWGISAVLFCFLKISQFLNKQNKSLSINVVLICVIIFIAFFNFEKVLALVNDFFEGDTNGENRLIIWGNAIKAWQHSPIFGLGPGSYSGTQVFGGFEAHNTFLQILTQGGAVAGIAYLFLVLKMTKATYMNTFILCAVVSLLMYGLGINDLRRSVLWFYYILFYFLCLTSRGVKN
ncbi:O-antigen ligase family protein [Neobacillus sp. LXY-4]|uniref:O-antigen ligase family protein n=1 Tax=Neobacillus sp. LXY-4 TaxID=3379826 RepID=UPI003EDFF569